MSRHGQQLIKAMKSALRDIKNDVPMRVTEYFTDDKGKLVRKVGMKRPSELKK